MFIIVSSLTWEMPLLRGQDLRATYVASAATTDARSSAIRHSAAVKSGSGRD
jgi:hypothetical protein